MAAARNTTSPRRSFLAFIGLAPAALATAEVKAAAIAAADDPIAALWQERERLRSVYLAAMEPFEEARASGIRDGEQLGPLLDLADVPLRDLRAAEERLVTARACTGQGVVLKLRIADEAMKNHHWDTAPLGFRIFRAAIEDLARLSAR